MGGRTRAATAAAVLAVVVPTALLTPGTDWVEPAPAPTTTAPTEAPAGLGLQVADLPQGEPPRVPWLDRGRYVAPGGSTQPIDVGLPDSVTRLGDGWLVTDARWFEGTTTLYRVADDGSVSATDTTTGVPVRSDDGRWVAWTTSVTPETGETGDDVLHLAPAADPRREHTLALPGVQALARVVDVVDGRVVFQRGHLDGSVWVTDLASEPVRVSGLRTAADGHGPTGLVAGQSADGRIVGGEAQDGAVVDLDTGEVVHDFPGWHLRSFSPDGTRLLAWRPLDHRQSGSELAVLDLATGDVVATIGTNDENHGWGPALWEDDAHLLVEVVAWGEQALVRAGLDGSLERATPVHPTAFNGTARLAEPRH